MTCQLLWLAATRLQSSHSSSSLKNTKFLFHVMLQLQKFIDLFLTFEKHILRLLFISQNVLEKLYPDQQLTLVFMVFLRQVPRSKTFSDLWVLQPSGRRANTMRQILFLTSSRNDFFRPVKFYGIITTETYDFLAPRKTKFSDIYSGL